MKNLLVNFAVALGGFTATLIAGFASADIPVDERAVATGGFGKWLLSSLFEAGSLSNQPDQAGIIGSVIQPFSLVCMLVIVGVIVVKSVQHVLIVAQAKDVESSPIAMTWAPLHLVVAVALALPLPSGYSAGQYTAIWVAEQSNLLGNLTSEQTIGEGDYTVITEIPLPSVRTTVQGIVDSHVCKVMLDAIGAYTAANGGAGVEVTARPMTDSEIKTLAGAPSNIYSDNGAGTTRAGVLYEAVRTGSGGNFVNQPTGLDSTCGSVIVEYDSFYKDDGFVEFYENANYRSTKARPDGSGGDCAGGIMCNLGDITRTGDKAAAANAFKGAHEDIKRRFLSLAKDGKSDTAPRVASAVNELTYDVGAYFMALDDPSTQIDYLELQLEEQARVERAAKLVVAEIDSLQSAIYSQYGSAIDQLRSTNNETGDSHKDAVLRSGWTVLGLYWFQQQSYNSQVLETVNFNAQSRMSVGHLMRIIEGATDDPEFAARMADRLSAYRRAVNREVLNTRLDANPLSGTASGGVPNSASALQDSIKASAISESLPTYIATMRESAENGQGATSADVMADWSPNHFFRSMIFPSIVSSLRNDNLVTGLVNTGHYMIVVAETAYVVQLLAKTTVEWNDRGAQEGWLTSAARWIFTAPDKAAQTGGAVFLNSWVGVLITEFLKDLTPLIMYMFFLGIFLAFYLPAVVMVQWIIGVVQWMIYVVEATVVIPLWAILFASDMGQKAFAPQTAQQGLIHLVSILFYPALMVIGFTIGVKVLDLMGMFLIDYIMIGFLNMTTGYTFGIVSTLVGVTLVGIVAYQVIMRIFSSMLELNDRAIGWVGNRASFGENNTEQAARSAMVAVIGRGENLSSRAASRQTQPSSPGRGGNRY